MKDSSKKFSYELDGRAYLTTEEYAVFNDAYVWFNGLLFHNELASCLITLSNRNRHSNGVYIHDKFSSREITSERVAEISLNPDNFKGRDDIEILSTLVHEMVHLWQYQTGEPSKGYHNSAWAGKMESIGLMPSSTGKPGGKRTGSRVTHYILEGEAFQKAANKFLENNQLTWQSNRTPATKPKDASKTKFHCDSCGLNAWAKLEAVLVCGTCGILMPVAKTAKGANNE